MKQKRRPAAKPRITRRATAPRPSPQEPEFQITFVGQFGYNDTVEARLTSAALDEAMHPAGHAPAHFEDSAIEDGKLPFTLDSFHVASVEAYLRSQDYVRSTLEGELTSDQRTWAPDEPAIDELWTQAKVESVDFRRRMVPTPELLKTWKRKMRMSAKEIMEALTEWDVPDTRSFFQVTLRCAWDEEHLLRADFRDGAFVSLEHS